MGTNNSTSSELVEDTTDHSEDTLIRPRFNTAAVQQAKPAVPVATAGSGRRSKVLLVVAVIAGILGGVLGSVFTLRYLQPVNQQATEVAHADPASPVVAQAGQPNDAGPAHKEASAAGQPPDTERKAAEAASPANEDAEDDKDESSSSTDLTAPIPSRDLAKDAPEADPSANRKELRKAFNSWMWATNQRDEAPQVQLSPDGNQATIRFRKRTKVEDENGERSGEAVQELRWRRVNGKWRMISEREVKIDP